MPWGKKEEEEEKAAMLAPAAWDPAAAGEKKPEKLTLKQQMLPAFTASTLQQARHGEVMILLGNYAEFGENHGRKYFRKIESVPGHPDVKVFLYFWDGRDGQDFSGWWFGDQVGGSQVWARCNSQGVTPPRVGWMVPWDCGKIDPGLLMVEPAEHKLTTGPARTVGAPQTVEEAQARAVVNREKVEDMEALVKRVMDDTRKEMKEANALENQDHWREALKTVQAKIQEAEANVKELQQGTAHEIGEVRKGGPLCQPVITEMSKVLPRIQYMAQQLKSENHHLKRKIPREKTPEELKREAEDRRVYTAAIPEVVKVVDEVKEALEGVSRMADKIDAESTAEAAHDALVEIEAAAKEVQVKVTDARTVINTHLRTTKMFAPDTQKQALKEFTGWQQQLTESQKALNVFKDYKKQFTNQMTSRKAFGEVSQELEALEAEVDSASLMKGIADEREVSAEAVKGAEQFVAPLVQKLTDHIRNIELKFSSVPVLRDRVAAHKERAEKAKGRLADFQAILRPKMDIVRASESMRAAYEKVGAAEDASGECDELELPFLKGVEVGPGEKTEEVLANCDEAAQKTQTLLGQALNFLKQKQMETKAYTNQEVAEKNNKEIDELLQTVENLQRKTLNFKQSTAERRTGVVVTEVSVLIKVFDAKMKTYATAATFFSGDNLEKEPLETLKEAMEKSLAAEKEASSSAIEARKVLQTKMAQARAGDTGGELSKINGTMTELQNKLATVRKNVSAAEKMIKCKDTLLILEADVNEVEAETAKVQDMSNGGAGEELSDDKILEMEDLSTATSKMISEVQKKAEAASSSIIASMRTQHQELKDRCKAADKALKDVKAKTKDPRERVLSDHFVKEAQKKALEVETAMEKVNDAELPFLKGIEVLPLASALASIEESEAAAENAKGLIAEVRTFVSAKSAELANFAKARADPAKEELLEVTGRINTASGTLNQFWKDLGTRRMTARVQETEQKIAELETDVKAAVEAADPFTKGEVESMSEEEASSICMKYLELEKAIQAKVGDLRVWLSSTLKEVRTCPENMDAVKKLQTKFMACQAELAAAKKSTSAHEQCLTAKRIHQEVAAMIAEMEVDLQKGEEAVAPLLERSTDHFLVASNARVVAGALSEYMQVQGLSVETMLSAVGTSQADFVEYFAKLPELLEKEELGTTEERRVAMFKQLDKDGDGKLSLQEFEAMFRQKYICRKEVSVTDSIHIDTGEALLKLKVGDVVTGIGRPRTEETGSIRVECLLEGGGTGFVTVKGNADTSFLVAVTPFDEFSQEAEKSLEVCQKALTKSLQAIRTKSQEFPRGAEGGRLAGMKVEFGKLTNQATAAQTKVLALKKKFAVAKMEHIKKEQAERVAHILAKEQREADALVGPAKESMAAVDASVKALEDECGPFTSLAGDALQDFATPAVVLESAESLSAKAQEAVAKARLALRDLQGKLGSDPKKPAGPLAEARKAVMGFFIQVEAADKATAKVLATVKERCRSITLSLSQQCSAALRASGQANEDIFAEMASTEDERIPEEVMRKKLLSLEGVGLRPEHAALICRQIGAGGIGRFAFLRFMQRYYVVVKSSVITDDLDIEGGNVLRKLDVDEVVELLEGPRADDKVGLTRVRGRCVRDGTSGWISIKGNQGTTFLEEIAKPYYVCAKRFSLDVDAKGKSEDSVRSLLAGEVMELIEGPVKEKLLPSTRARGKAMRDNTAGWVTVASSRGATFLQEGKFFTCLASLALTSEASEKGGTTLKKLAAGEVVEAVGGEPQEEDGVKRMKVKTLKTAKSEELEGWVTMQSPTGQPLVQASKKYYTALEAVPIQRSQDAATAATTRTLAKGEVFQVMEGPKEETPLPSLRAKVKALSDAAIGWITLASSLTSLWTPNYTCRQAVPMHDTISPDGAIEVRQIAVGEVVELLDGPRAEGGVLRLRGRAASDGAVGWVTVRTDEGGVNLEPAAPPPPSKRGR